MINRTGVNKFNPHENNGNKMKQCEMTDKYCTSLDDNVTVTSLNREPQKLHGWKKVTRIKSVCGKKTIGIKISLSILILSLIQTSYAYDASFQTSASNHQYHKRNYRYGRALEHGFHYKQSDIEKAKQALSEEVESVEDKSTSTEGKPSSEEEATNIENASREDEGNDLDDKEKNDQETPVTETEDIDSKQGKEDLDGDSSEKKEEEYEKETRGSRDYDDDDSYLPDEFQKPEIEYDPRWYTLSHYLDKNSILYDTIEGFLLAGLACLILSTFYSWTYYCFWVRFGCCPDDRLLRRKLLRKGIVPRRFWNKFGRMNRRSAMEQDGKGLFTPIGVAKPDTCEDEDEEDEVSFLNENRKQKIIGFHNNNDDDMDSSLSDDSILSMEYGDVHLHDEYGEVTDRLEDNKMVNAARNYFEKKPNGLLASTKAAVVSAVKSKKMRKKGGKSVRSRMSSNRSVASRVSIGSNYTSKASQKSILSSSSEECYSSSDGEGEIEIENAMMDLELVERKLLNNKPDNVHTLL